LLLAARSYFAREYFSWLALGYFGILVFGGLVASRWLIRHLLVTDHTDYDYARIVREFRLVVDSRNATRAINAPNVVTLLI
jgi:hypothetical protein